eukprot:TRINITY_DN27366_c0_g1_i2.p1 TRINITY_DN27366_c0_g1~~TRINITY_DN27366_c0_g1_i2.p1  ORF type:complete len:413 (+),score=106.10 TRINITY_DN27366_c0_g1_i2:200-1438(+)
MTDRCRARIRRFAFRALARRRSSAVASVFGAQLTDAALSSSGVTGLEERPLLFCPPEPAGGWPPHLAQSAARLNEAEEFAQAAIKGMAGEDAESALRHAEQCVRNLSEELGRRHSCTALAFDLLGDAACVAGHYRDAVEHYKTALAVLLSCVASDAVPPPCGAEALRCPRHVVQLDGGSHPLVRVATPAVRIGFFGAREQQRAGERCRCRHHALFAPRQQGDHALFNEGEWQLPARPHGSLFGAPPAERDGAALPQVWTSEQELYCEGCGQWICVDCAAACGGAYSENEIIDLLQYKIGTVLLHTASGHTDAGASFSGEDATAIRDAQEFLAAALAARDKRHRRASNEQSVDALTALAAAHYARGDHNAARELGVAAVRHRLRISQIGSEEFANSCERLNINELRDISAGDH